MVNISDVLLKQSEKNIFKKIGQYTLQDACILHFGFNPSSYYQRDYIIKGMKELLKLIEQEVQQKKFTLDDMKTGEVTFQTFQKWLQDNDIESEFFETTAINNENDFYKIPKNHKCVTPKTKALIETLLHFIENETELHDAKSGMKEVITQRIRDNNTYKIPQTAIEKEITPILNWTHIK